MRQRLLPAGRLWTPAGLAPGVVHSKRGGEVGQGQKPAADALPRRRLEADHGYAQADSVEQHPRRGYRHPGGGDDQAVAALEGAGGRERAAQPGVGACSARPGKQHPVRQLADRGGLF